MKKLILILLLVPALHLKAQNTRFISVMEKNIAIMDTTTTRESMQNLSNQFERIGNAEPTEWLPGYYRAWLNIMMSFQEKDMNKKDAMLDMALNLIEMADSLKADNSEIYALKSFALSMKIGIDPATRGQKLGMESAVILGQAMKLDPENPRVYLLKGQNAMYTPAQYGGGKEIALPLLEKAVEKYKTFIPQSSIMPHWGAKRAKEVLEQCKSME